MPEPRSIDPLAVDSARRQHTAAADRLFQRIINCAQAGRVDIAHGRPPTAAARQIDSDITSLLETLAELRTVEKFAARVRKAA